MYFTTRCKAFFSLAQGAVVKSYFEHNHEVIAFRRRNARIAITNVFTVEGNYKAELKEK